MSYTCQQPMQNANGTIDLLWDHPEYGLIPFTASPDDSTDHGKEIYKMAFNGDFGALKKSDPEPKA